MKKTICLLLFLFFIGKINAQQATVFLSPDQNDEYTDAEIFGFNERNFFVISAKADDSFYLESLTSKELRRIFKKKIELPQIDGKTVDFENILYFNQHIYVFSSLYNKKTKTYTAYINEISASGELSLNHTIVDEVILTEKKPYCAFHFSLSADSNRILEYREYAESDLVKGKIIYKVISKGLKPLFSKEIELSQPFNKIAISNVLLDSDRNLYYTEKEYVKSEDASRTIVKLNVVSYKAEEDTLYRSEIVINEDRFLDVSLQLSAQEQLICSGTYAVEKDQIVGWENAACIKGVYFYMFDAKDLHVISKGHKNIQELFPDEKLQHYRLVNSYQLKAGPVMMICEFQQTVCPDGICNDKRGPIIVTTFDPALNNSSVQRIITSQKDEKPGCKGSTSFIPFPTENAVTLLYNCNRQFEINKTGIVTEKPVFSASNLAFHKFYYWINANELLIATYSKKKETDLPGSILRTDKFVPDYSVF